jgi:DNA-binding transcriptional regulator YiaG
MDNQDWTPVVVNKVKAKSQIVAKHTNPEYTLLKKLENEEIHVKAKMFSHESKQTIIQYRISNTLSQADLDARCNFPKDTIQQLEANKRAPTTKELQTLNRVLKTGLTLN